MKTYATFYRVVNGRVLVALAPSGTNEMKGYKHASGAPSHLYQEIARKAILLSRENRRKQCA